MRRGNLDVNMGMGGIDEKEMMLKALDTVTSRVALPLAIDTSHADVMEAALRSYPGRALINSVSLEQAKSINFCRLRRSTARCLYYCRCPTMDYPKILAKRNLL